MLDFEMIFFTQSETLKEKHVMKTVDDIFLDSWIIVETINVI